MAVTLAVFGINNRSVDTGVKVLLLFLFVVWAALVFWTYADARRRIDDPMLVACATAASLFPFVGTIVYTIVRPPEFLDDVRLRELEMHAAENRLYSGDVDLCPNCDYQVRGDFLRCPNCRTRLKEPCTTCGKPLEPQWDLCPFCETEVRGASSAPPEPTVTRRRRRTQEETVDFPAP